MEAGPVGVSHPGSLFNRGLERNVLFLGTGLKPGKEASDVSEVSEAWLLSSPGWLFREAASSARRFMLHIHTCVTVRRLKPILSFSSNLSWMILAPDMLARN